MPCPNDAIHSNPLVVSTVSLKTPLITALAVKKIEAPNEASNHKLFLLGTASVLLLSSKLL